MPRLERNVAVSMSSDLQVLERRLGTPGAHNGSRKLAPNRPFQHNTRYCSRSFIRITFARRVECSLHHPGTLPRTTSFYLLNRRLLALSEQSALCTFFSLFPPGLAALLRSAGFFSGAVFFARMTLARSVFQGFQIGFKRFWSILYQKKVTCYARQAQSLDSLAQKEPFHK